MNWLLGHRKTILSTPLFRHIGFNYIRSSIFLYFLSFLAAECGGDINAPTGSITTPYFPSNYPIYTECTWIISPTEFGDTQITFDDFETESSYDDLVVRNGTDSNSPEIGSFEGTLNNPRVALTSSNGFHIFFESDYALTYGGFRINYQPSTGELVIVTMHVKYSKL